MSFLRWKPDGQNPLWMWVMALPMLLALIVVPYVVRWLYR